MRILALIGALAIVVGIGAAIFFFGGFYSVAGTAEDPAVVTWALTHVRNASINRYALDQPPASINLSDPATVQAGAKHRAIPIERKRPIGGAGRFALLGWRCRHRSTAISILFARGRRRGPAPVIGL